MRNPMVDFVEPFDKLRAGYGHPRSWFPPGDVFFKVFKRCELG
jgi:hypothetical protein